MAAASFFVSGKVPQLALGMTNKKDTAYSRISFKKLACWLSKDYQFKQFINIGESCF
jgi:hypothetical protein